MPNLRDRGVRFIELGRQISEFLLVILKRDARLLRLISRQSRGTKALNPSSGGHERWHADYKVQGYGGQAEAKHSQHVPIREEVLPDRRLVEGADASWLCLERPQLPPRKEGDYNTRSDGESALNPTHSAQL